jgi:signal transduction histidine kinase
MPNGGKLTISAKKNDDKIVISVGDTGVGIPEGYKARIFSPLYTTKTGGMGLGLTYCRRAVGAQGGSIDFESEVGKGTTFTIRLPTQ